MGIKPLRSLLSHNPFPISLFQSNNPLKIAPLIILYICFLPYFFIY